MIKVDLITGFLGSGKTTFIKKYVSYLMHQGQKIGILENDFGAVNVDMLLLQELQEAGCDLEMISGGCDRETHRRRFRTKLIAMGMCGYDRVIVEPSGIYDPDEFFDALYDEPLCNWYEAGNVIAIVDATLPETLSNEADYLLASEIAGAGLLVFSRVDLLEQADRTKADSEITLDDKYGAHKTIMMQIERALSHINRALSGIKCDRRITTQEILAKSFWEWSEKEFLQAVNAGYVHASYQKRNLVEGDIFSSLYFMEHGIREGEIREVTEKLFEEKENGTVFRIKGFLKAENGGWLEINATRDSFSLKPVKNGQEVIIVIGEKLDSAMQLPGRQEGVLSSSKK